MLIILYLYGMKKVCQGCERTVKVRGKKTDFFRVHTGFE